MSVSFEEAIELLKSNGYNEKIGAKFLVQVRRGIEIEHEHSDLPGFTKKTALKIALAHLKEFPDYYTHLDLMEAKLELQK
jgi:hypothetical protein